MTSGADITRCAPWSADLLRILIRTNAVQFAVIRAGYIVEANDAFLNLTRYRRADVTAGRLRVADIVPKVAEAQTATGPYDMEPAMVPYTARDGRTALAFGGITPLDERDDLLYFCRTAAEEIEPPPRLSDVRLRRLFDANLMGIVIANNAGAILDANDAFLTLIGYTRVELETGLIDWRRLTPPEWLRLDENAIAEMALHGTFAQYEKEYIRKDGTRVPISLGGARTPGSSDEQICYIFDLSAVRAAQAALARSESRFRRLSEANVIGIIGTRYSDDAILEANDEFLRIIGYTREELEDHRIGWTDLTPPDWRFTGLQAKNEIDRNGSFAPIEKEYFRKDGSRIPVLVAGARLETSSDEVVCYVLDLSAQKAATAQIQERERRYRVLAEALPQIVMVADENRRFTYVNRRYTEYTGLELQDSPDFWADAIHPDDIEAIMNARAAGRSYEVEYRLRRASDGAYRWHFARVLDIADGSPQDRWLAVAIDIDDRKRAENALRFIEKAGSLLSQSLDSRTTLTTLLELVVPEYGDWATVSLRDSDGGVKTVAAHHREPTKTAVVRELCGADFFSATYSWGDDGVHSTDVAQIRSALTPADLPNVFKAQYIPIVEELGYGSLIALPIPNGTAVIGTLFIVSTAGRRTYSAADLPALEELTRRAGFAIENARQYEREHRVASLLQEAALPRTLPRLSGYRFDAYYRAGRNEASIGGDWYDALVLADGRIVICVGDVAGSGLHAAVLMGNVRQVIRGAAHVHASPLEMFEIADRTLRSEHDSTMVTAFVGVIDPESRTMVYASAGHLPALLRLPGGTVTELHAPGLPLGLRNLAAAASATATLPTGSSLLLYTDGLVEWSHDIIAGQARLRERFAASSFGADAHPARALVDGLLPEIGSRDDVAALLVAID